MAYKNKTSNINHNNEKLTIRIIFVTFFTWLLVGVILFIEYTIFIFPVVLYTLIVDRKLKRPMLWLTKFFIRIFFATYFTSNFKIDLKGLKKTGNPRIYMLNHASQFDTFLMYLLPGLTTYFVKKYYTKLPFIGWTISLSGNIYVDKINTNNQPETVNKGIEAIKNGYSLIIFPEGTKSRDGNIGRFKSGGFKIAYETKAEIVPIVLDTWNSIRPGGGGWIRDDKVWMKSLKPIPYETYKNIDTKNFSRILKYKMTEELLKIRNERRKKEKNYYRKMKKYIELDKKAEMKLEDYKNSNKYLFNQFNLEN